MGAPKQQVTYGDFSFGYHNMSVTQRPRVSDNEIDQTGIIYEFKIRGWLTAKTTAAFADLVTQTQCQLAKFRQTMLVKWSDDGSNYNTLYSFAPTDDVHWGPIPGALNIQEIVAGRAAMFEWSVTVVSKQCFSGACGIITRPSEILTISRSYQFDVDPNGLTRRTISGRLEVTSKSVQNGRPADYYRSNVTPGIPGGYNRDGEHFTQSPNGRFLDFSIIDQERVWTLPQPVTTGRATWSVSLPNAMVLIAIYRLSGSFTAPATVSKDAIINQILQLATNRFPPAAQITRFLTKELSEDVYGNTVNFSFTATGPIGATGKPGDPPTGNSTFGGKPPNSGASQPIGAYGGDGNTSSGVSGGTPSIYDSCNGNPGQPTYSPIPSGSPTPGTTGAPSTPPGTYTNPGTQYVDQAHLDAAYTVYKETISYEVNNGWKLFYPKTVGVAPLKQRISNPRLFIIQAGYAKRWGNDATQGPVVPKPIYSDNQAVLHTKSIAPSNPTPDTSSNRNEYGIEWIYKMEWTGSSQDASSIQPTYPRDGRRDNAGNVEGVTPLMTSPS